MSQPHQTPQAPAERADCSIEGCERKAFCRTFCQAHYRRWYRYGDPLAVKPRKVAQPRDWRPRWDAKVTVKRNGCHEWEGLYIRGIPVFLAPNDLSDDRSRKHRVMAHRWIWLQAHPEVKGLRPADRLIRECGNGRCVNPAHMRTVTRADVQEAKQQALARRRRSDAEYRARMREDPWVDERLPA